MISLRLKIATTHTMMSKLTVKNDTIQQEKQQKTAYKIFPKKIRNHSSDKCKWCFNYTMLKNSKINETCAV